MIFDRQTLLSDAQAVTATANSANVIALGPVATGLTRDIGMGRKIPLAIQVVETFNNLTSLTVEVIVSDVEAMTAPKVIQSATLALADLKAGKKFTIDAVPSGTNGRFMALKYTVAGTAPTKGKVTAGVVMGVPSYG